MGNTFSSYDEKERRGLILLPENYIRYNLNEDNYKKCEENKVKKNIEKDKSLKNDLSTKNNKSIHENEHYELNESLINDLIKENELYIKNYKDELININQDSIKIPQTKNECLYSENNIYNCLKSMNESTFGFLNSYSRCYKYLREYESCVQRIKI
ncbi:hypothetical protein PFAG_03181 [Plasmodium falciparum Santa Lucia]|uniref:Uncharacterized protein n=8 Tax=Plasmodium falciparum TaxID=5833 RepID=Q8IIR5_PLAF7|nr:conserved Plasmodium protein, unknown function [Plasmodium falciparum 3D7]ETW17964.1 hypothetical protein PFFVO_03191 [Plasmodium falciparum Vietnam Oak-Knoll (FVO)]ETW36066.1 hypothetical protein PFTANZ_03222 [Plasmodium falciparum Tanzania (2000708)]ETW52714.1 hypothetical protein PFUGPA_05021 [Plasmodium falciparum Palo Alto/Uganda]ETW60920.1 hypothetical protein PFMC_03151 [Plasmodium falciparum CAMP/Malaysia]EUT84089.1 hypothetical protein PFAG_03181 [Plasmodium falciparum Santa Lucia]|eukprot:XP_001347775.1 conserved Plasmodium protein, unknown function [Plasmodium falciparum 3D7]